MASATFVLILAGALVTSNDAGLAVPDWPTSFGSIYKIPPMVGGVKYEHGHRMIAQFVGLLTIGLAVWTWRVERRAWMRKLGWSALALVIIQGILGGTTVLNYLPPPVSAAHATLAQTFFCLLMLMAVFTSRDWMASEIDTRADQGAPGIRTLSTLLVLGLYLQLVMGAAFRHVWTKLGPNAANQLPAGDIVAAYLVPHIVNALLVAVVVVWTASRVLSSQGQLPQLRRPALALLYLLLMQLALGFGAYLTRVEWGQQAAQPMSSMVLTTAAHVGVGALMLAAAVVLAAQARRHLAAQPLTERAGMRDKAVPA